MNQASSEQEAMEDAHSISACLLVDIGGEVFGISVGSVKEVIEFESITTVPMCSGKDGNGIVSGVINVRGSVVPVIDAGKRLGLQHEKAYDKYSCIVLYESYDEASNVVVTVGILVNRVKAIEGLAQEALTDAPYFGVHIPAHFVSTMARIEDQVFIILDMPVLLNLSSINQDILSNQKQLFNQLLS
ncbi:chemotaxis protein CheW [Vibrio gallaecicus]|uniref:Chemotaxis protein CheW n=1 Tax=Vibrio gallaecicus TaxID=552386 RepID=A0ABV4NBY6_9VIBR|nr:chemotaxis protein CheW [Vibrio gallaecicus]MDN3613667.1 chemotaxis protein CheW [Vibrio gallaecicus]